MGSALSELCIVRGYEPRSFLSPFEAHAWPSNLDVSQPQMYKATASFLHLSQESGRVVLVRLKGCEIVCVCFLRAVAGAK